MATFILSTLPVLMRGYYPLACALIVSALSAASALAFFPMVRRWPISNRVLAYGVLVFAAVVGMPIMSEALFWMCGIATYLAGAVLLLLGWRRTHGKTMAGRGAGWLCMAVACGCSEVCAGLALAFVLWHAWCNGWRRAWLPLLLVGLAATALLAGPGNFVRRGVVPYSGDVVIGLGAGLYSAARLLLTTAPVLMSAALVLVGLSASAFSVGKFADVVNSTSGRANKPYDRLWLGYAAAVFFVGHIGIATMAGSAPQQRVENVFWLYALVVTTILCVKLRTVRLLSFTGGPGWSVSIGCVGLVLCAFCTNNGLRTAWKDWLSGDGRAYHQAMLRQEAMLAAQDSDIAEMPPLYPLPATLFSQPTFSTVAPLLQQSPTTDWACEWNRKRLAYYTAPLDIPQKRGGWIERELKALRVKWRTR